MVSYSVLCMLLFDVVICYVLPIAVFIFLQRKYKKLFKPLIIGALAFFISQIAIRIPILNYILPQFAWFSVFQAKYPYLYWIFLGLTAGIFEEVARFIMIKLFMKNNQRYIDSISFGIGHGAIEAMIITGVSVINMLVLCIMINSGTFESSLVGVPDAAIQATIVQCTSLTAVDAILVGIERIFAMCMHIGFTIIVFEGFRKNKSVLYLIIAILAHGIVDSSIGFMTMMFGMTAVQIEIVFGIIALIFILYTIRSYKNVD